LEEEKPPRPPGWLLAQSLEAAGALSVLALGYRCRVSRGRDLAPLGSARAGHERSVLDGSSIAGVWWEVG